MGLRQSRGTYRRHLESSSGLSFAINFKLTCIMGQLTPQPPPRRAFKVTCAYCRSPQNHESEQCTQCGAPIYNNYEVDGTPPEQETTSIDVALSGGCCALILIVLLFLLVLFLNR